MNPENDVVEETVVDKISQTIVSENLALPSSSVFDIEKELEKVRCEYLTDKLRDAGYADEVE